MNKIIYYIIVGIGIAFIIFLIAMFILVLFSFGEAGYGSW